MVQLSVEWLRDREMLNESEWSIYQLYTNLKFYQTVPISDENKFPYSHSINSFHHLVAFVNQSISSFQNKMKLTSMVLLLPFVLFAISSAIDMPNVGYTDAHMTTTNEEINAMYMSWRVKHGKFYNSVGENTKRFQIFNANFRYIEQHNSRNSSYKLGLNKFADMSPQEYRLLNNGAKNMHSRRKFNNVKSDRYSVYSGDVIPDFIDWRNKGAVAPIKDQGLTCGSCWAFSTTGSMEAINQIVTGDLITLSEQELVDCDTSYSAGCDGGYIEHAFEFIVNNGGIDSDKGYPYTGIDGRCDTTKKNAKLVSIDGYEAVPENDELALKKAVANQPVSVYIDASSQDFEFYKSGIFNGSCGTYLDHAVVVVGYGTEDGKDYWIVKNSWGEEWGEQGYMRIERNIKEKEGKCGIAMEAYYPIKNGPNPPTPSPSPQPQSHPRWFLGRTSSALI
ncbi:hypothetical protein QVD17_16129 [Tagetes erecta]|uniref:Actinidain n=1 Tax=Tagetes erecta TaxID=13708 RepID=A0AAD8NZA9_TARER|nr:hypothetical protein QVD17_16129 [Tagetes erecta]